MYTHATEAGWISRSHQAISPFSLVRPDTVEEAFAANNRGGATIIAGGIDLVRRMRSGDVWQTLIDISAIGDMKGIREDGDFIRIGALATHWEIEADPLLAEHLPDFQAAWTTIGNIRVRLTGTLGGNLMARERGYDGVLLLGVAGAEIVFMTLEGEISVPANTHPDEFPPQGLLVAVRIPVVPGRRLAFDRSLKPVVSVAVSLRNDDVCVGVGCAFPTPVFRLGAGDISAGTVSDALPEPIDNPLGRASYRRRMAGILAARAAASLQGGG